MWGSFGCKVAQEAGTGPLFRHFPLHPVSGRHFLKHVFSALFQVGVSALLLGGRQDGAPGHPGVRLRNVCGKSGPKRLCLCFIFFPDEFGARSRALWNGTVGNELVSRAQFCTAIDKVNWFRKNRTCNCNQSWRWMSSLQIQPGAVTA